MTNDNKEINLAEASIEDLRRALDSGHLISVELVARYLRQIGTYDRQNLSLNAIPILNNSVFVEAAASDDRRAAGKELSPLEGTPYTIKDSFKVMGMTAAAVSPTFKYLVSIEIAAVVASIRASEGAFLGRTNIPAVACRGMQRHDGRAEHLYNPDYRAAAFALGSFKGLAASTAASFAALSIGTEIMLSSRLSALSVYESWQWYPNCEVPVGAEPSLLVRKT